MRTLVLLLLFVGLRAEVPPHEAAQLVGYTVVAATSVEGTFSGGLIGDVVVLANGAAFRLQSSHVQTRYAPVVVVLARTFTPQQFAAAGMSPPDRPLTDYRLVIGDGFYRAERLR